MIHTKKFKIGDKVIYVGKIPSCVSHCIGMRRNKIYTIAYINRDFCEVKEDKKFHHWNVSDFIGIKDLSTAKLMEFMLTGKFLSNVKSK